MASAENVGKKLLGEVEEVALDEILRTLRLQDGSVSQHFNFHPLDRLLQKVIDTRPDRAKTYTTPPLIELMSITPGGGKTHLLYHLCAQATLPYHLNGTQACVIIIDTDNNFSVPRLATQLQLLLRNHEPHTYKSAEGAEHQALNNETLSALKHVHIFRPQSLAFTVATLNDLPSYLFNSTRHFSFDRKVAFIAIDSASAFYWQDRAETEDAAFLASTTTATGPKQPSPRSGYVALSTSLASASKTLSCPSIITSWFLGPQPKQHGQDSHSFRPQLPALHPDLRLVVHRLPVRKFPPGISVEQALREAGDRQSAVEEGKFECFVNEWGLEERVLRSLGSGGGFGFRITKEGLIVDEEEV